MIKTLVSQLIELVENIGDNTWSEQGFRLAIKEEIIQKSQELTFKKKIIL